MSKSQKELNFSLTPKEMEPFLEKAANALGSNMQIKGFREGNAPRSVVEKSVGEGKVWEEAAQMAVEDTYTQELQKGDIEPVGKPKVDVLKLAPGNNFDFKITIPLLPDFELPDYKKIAQDTIEKENKGVDIEEKEVDEAIKWLRYSRSEAYKGDMGKTPQDVDEKDLPKLDDNFAKEVGNFKSVEELRDNIKKGIKREKEAKEKDRLRLLIVEGILKKTDMDVSPLLVEEELNKMQDELAQQVSNMDMTLEKYLENANQTVEDLRKSWKGKAEDRVKTSLLLQKIAKDENIQAEEKEVEEEAGHYLRHFESQNQATDQIDPALLRAYISGIIRNEKVFELLEKAKTNQNQE